MYTFMLALLTISAPLAHADRAAPKPVKPLLHAGLRYEVPQFAAENKKMKHNGGYVRVVNPRNGTPICTKQVYETKYETNVESDTQDNFITSLAIKKNALIVVSENLPPQTIPLANFCD